MSEQKQNKGASKPRVIMNVEVERNGALVKEELPFELLVMADLSGDGKKKDLRDRMPTQINLDNFDQVMESLRPTLNLEVEVGDKTMAIKDLIFDSMEKFTPQALIDALVDKNYGPIAELWKRREELLQLKNAANTDPEFAKKFGELLKKK
jgi:type VI secretion system ImpB/VipA family protein